MHKVTFILLVIGGLNWLLALFGWDLANWGLPMIVVQAVYVLVGLSAIYEAVTHKQNCRACSAGAAPAQPAQPA
jgi:uncharacterized membrane protein YuzA (DUF378 family)